MKNDNHVQSEQQAQMQFQKYVRRVAFQLTLSAPMIAALRLVRDDVGWSNDQDDQMSCHKQIREIRSPMNGQCLFISEMRALEHRGLVRHVMPNVPEGKSPWIEGHRFFQLTKVGGLTCDLLVEAGLMLPTAKTAKKRKAA